MTINTDASVFEQRIDPKQRDLGGFEVARVLPALVRRSVGPFVFLIIWGRIGSKRARRWTCGRIRTSASRR